MQRCLDSKTGQGTVCHQRTCSINQLWHVRQGQRERRWVHLKSTHTHTHTRKHTHTDAHGCTHSCTQAATREDGRQKYFYIESLKGYRPSLSTQFSSSPARSSLCSAKRATDSAKKAPDSAKRALTSEISDNDWLIYIMFLPGHSDVRHDELLLTHSLTHSLTSSLNHSHSEEVRVARTHAHTHAHAHMRGMPPPCEWHIWRVTTLHSEIYIYVYTYICIYIYI